MLVRNRSLDPVTDYLEPVGLEGVLNPGTVAEVVGRTDDSSATVTINEVRTLTVWLGEGRYAEYQVFIAGTVLWDL